jgi:hypothetical protein
VLKLDLYISQSDCLSVFELLTLPHQVFVSLCFEFLLRLSLQVLSFDLRLLDVVDDLEFDFMKLTL